MSTCKSVTMHSLLEIFTERMYIVTSSVLSYSTLRCTLRAPANGCTGVFLNVGFILIPRSEALGTRLSRLKWEGATRFARAKTEHIVEST